MIVLCFWWQGEFNPSHTRVKSIAGVIARQVELGIIFPYRVSGQPHGNKVKILRKPCYLAGRKFSLEFKFCYFANDELA